MKQAAFRLSAATVLTLIMFSISGCVGFGPSVKERASQLERSLTESDIGVSRAEVIAPASFSASLVVTVALEDQVLEVGPAVSTDALKDILRVVGRDATAMNVGYAILYAKDADGSDVSMAEAADQLGMSEAVSDGSLSLSKADLSELASG